MTLYICIYPGESDSIFVSMQSLLGDDLYASNEHPVELYFDSDGEKWVDDNGAFLAFDENSSRFIYSDPVYKFAWRSFLLVLLGRTNSFMGRYTSRGRIYCG